MGYLDHIWTNYHGILIPGGKKGNKLVPPGQGGQIPGKGTGGGNTGGGSSAFTKVQLLLHGDGTGGASVITDNSSYNRSVSSNVAVTTGTSTKVFGTASLSFAGSAGNGGLKYTGVAGFQLGSQDFTLEFFIRNNIVPAATQYITGQYDGADLNTASFLVFHQNDEKMRFDCYSGTTKVVNLISSVGYTKVGPYYYFAVTRSGSTFTMYKGDSGSLGSATTVVGTATYAGAINNVSTNLGIGRIGDAAPGGASEFIGFIDEYRFTVGAVQDCTVVPAAAFPNS